MGMLSDLRIIYHMTFTKVAINAGLADSLFVFTPPAGAVVVPLEMR